MVLISNPVEVISADANEIYDAMSNVIHFDIPGGEPITK